MAKSIKDVVGSKLKKYLRPLKEGERAEFVLLNANKKDPWRDDEIVVPPDVQLAAKENIYDPDLKRTIRVECVEGYDSFISEDGREINKPMYKKPRFEEGRCIVDHTQMEQYYFLLVSNKNKSNPFRRKDVKAEFELVDNNAILREKYSKNDYMFDAMLWVKELADHDELRAIATNLPKNQYNVGNMDDLYSLKLQLIDIAKTDPLTIIKNSKDIKTKKKIQVDDALRFGLMEWHEESKTFYSLIKNEAEELCSVELGEDRMKKIVDFFESKEGTGHYLAIAKQLKQLKTA